jgi:hypothetical protein
MTHLPVLMPGVSAATPYVFAVREAGMAAERGKQAQHLSVVWARSNDD